jgi:hypothetical protein
MKWATPRPEAEAHHVTPRPPASYADQLTAYEARRRAADDILLRKMVNPREESITDGRRSRP